jgi:hypothetical protein
VQWEYTLQKFLDVGMNDQGTTPRYAGVQADEVAARGGQLVLRSRPRNQAGAPAVVIDGATPGAEEFRYGFQDAGGLVQPVFRITAKGDVIATGQIQGAVAAGGSLQVQSGTATDGVILPLPPGVTEDMVKPGKAAFHVLLTPSIPLRPADATGGDWGCVPIGVGIDDQRRLQCLLRFFQIPLPAAAPFFEDRTGACDYLILVAVPASPGVPP